MKVIESTEIPESMPKGHALRLIPKNLCHLYYRERTDRNLGWITPFEQQQTLQNAVIGIAGTGGMGGLLASIFLRLGVGEIRIADSEVFDVSNINRQFAATRSTINKSKALETLRMLREISDDTTIIAYPQGITDDSVNHFISGCDVIADEIEVMAIDARILLHQRARVHGVSLFNCNTAGFSTNLFLYTPTSMTMEAVIGLSYEEAKQLRERAEDGDVDAASKIARVMVRAVVPKLPEYRPNNSETDEEAFYRRFIDERKVPIIATNPPMATGFLADRILLYLLRDSEVKREVVQTPEIPGYLHFDAAHMQAFVGSGEWISHDKK
jgi:molybdopterin/thiamine biosynthesis adenylyltransferase